MFLTIFTFLIILSILVLVHELGHFLVAKKTGISVEEFGFGLPPRVFGVKRGKTIYSINWLPIGGFVKLYGEDEQPRKPWACEAGAFFAKPKKIRMAVIVSGVLMNFLLAVFAFSIIYAKLGIPTKTDRVKIVGIAPGSPAEKAGLKEGDIAVWAGGEEIKNTESFIKITQKYAGKMMALEISREKDNPCKEKVLGAWPGLEISCKGKNLVFSIIPREKPPEGEGPLGVAISQVEMKFYPLWEMIPRGTVEGFKEAFAWTGMIVGALGAMLWQLIRFGTVPKDVAGPVGIFQITGQVSRTGILSVLQFLGILSVNLAVINILPLPALDGGRLLFILVEAVTGKRSHLKFERWVHTVGMALLLFLILLITINDIARILQQSGFVTHLKSLLPF
ncbi:MAG: M50 family metallopeptidase [Patescibacteria group bacterium]